MPATYEEIRAGVLGFIGAAMDEEPEKLMAAVKSMESKLKLSIGATIIGTEDVDTNEIKISYKFTAEKVEVKTEGLTEKKERLKKVASK
jgi:hypothetical protein